MSIYNHLILIICLFIIHKLFIKGENYTPSIGMSFVEKNNSFKYINVKSNSKKFIIAIVTTFLHYRSVVLNSFVRSLDNVNFKGHIILFVSEVYHLNFSNPIIHQILLSDKYPYYSSNNDEFSIPIHNLEEYLPSNCDWKTLRYYVFSIWLKHYHSKFNYIYYCDGRDVLFQLNPYMWNFGKGVHLTLESDKVKIRNSKWNVMWTADYKMGDEIYDQHVINGGTIFGSSIEITLFISQMIYMMKYLNQTCSNDQGAFMYFYYSHPQFKYPVYLDKQGYGYTLALNDLSCDYFFTDYCNIRIFINESKIRNLDQTIPVILHGIERWKNTKNKTRRKEYYNFINKYFPYYASKNN